ncbi:MAG: hypothetical protein KGZ63_07905 [Clostridiales bacterium]|jgi:hypothetical protein|nr:hypothetical protein [Clostridiales bacterium]
MNTGRKNQMMKKRVGIISKGSPGKVVRRRPRASEEEQLLIRTVLSDIKKMEQKGVLVRNGRLWKFNF